MTYLTTVAADKGTYVVTCAFTDEDGADVVPTAITWTLTDADGAVVNSRQDVAVTTPAASVDVVLSGDDLAYSAGSSRIFVVEATYTGSLGAGLPLKGQCAFAVEDLPTV